MKVIMSAHFRILFVVSACALLAACAQPAEEQLHGKLRNGSGGPDIDETQLMSHIWADSDGKEIGSFEYDASVFLHYHPDPDNDALHVVANITPDVLIADLADDGIINNISVDEVLMIMTRIVGRPDTPCRFQAALQARDQRYKILASGDRKNNRGLELHQVNLRNKKLPASQRFYCFELKKPFGIQINVFTADEEHQDWREVLALLNSVDRS